MAFVHGNAEIIADKPGGIEYFIFHQIRIGAKIRISFTPRH